MSDRLRQLAQLTVSSHAPSAKPGEELIEASAPVSTAASMYERVRNALEYQEDHLLRRNAILRILKRFVGTHANLREAAGNLLHELVWAKYLPNKAIPVSLTEQVANVIERYEPLLAVAEASGTGGDDGLTHWVLDVLATEIESILAPSHADDVLVSFMYDELKKRTEWDPALGVSEEDRDLRFYVAVHRSLLKSTPATLQLRVFTLYYPTWTTLTAADPLVAEIAKSLAKVVDTVEKQINDPLTDRLTRILRRKAGIFRVVGDVTRGVKHNATLFDEPEKLDAAVKESLHHRTKEFYVRLRRTVVRAVIFLVITKMALALMLELPYDAFFLAGHAPLYPLFVNIFFHPLFLALVSLTVTINEKQNDADYVAAVRALSVGADHPVLHIRVKKEVRTRRSMFFDGVYGLLFIVVYGLIGAFLHTVGFHALSIGLFLFFLSLVTFFGLRIRMSTRDIVAGETRSGLAGTIFDILFLPIVRAGAWLSERVSKINVFIYFFDFIIEAPLKVAIQFVEGWLAFVREKKEEI